MYSVPCALLGTAYSITTKRDFVSSFCPQKNSAQGKVTCFFAVTMCFSVQFVLLALAVAFLTQIRYTDNKPTETERKT